MIREDDLSEVLNVVKRFSVQRVYHMRQQVQFFFNNYIKSMKAITLTTLQMINDRVFPFAARSYDDWNDIPNQVSLF